MITAIQSGGLWACFIGYPFNVTPSPDERPPSIYVTLDNDEPHLPSSSVYLQDNIDNLKYGLDVLKVISGDKLYVGVSEKNKDLKSQLSSISTHELVGDYPANNPGVFLYYNKTTAEENNSWGIRAQDLIRIALLLKEGKYPIERTISLSGPFPIIKSLNLNSS